MRKMLAKTLGWLGATSMLDLILAAVVLFIVAVPVFMAWNCLTPITKLPEIGFWHAASGLFLLGVVRNTLLGK